MTDTVFGSRQVCRITGLTERQLRYWRDTGMIAPSGRTPGGHARYSFTDLIALRAVRRLLEAGISIQRTRRCVAALIERLPTVSLPLAQATLLVTGDVVLVLHHGAAFDAISGQQWIMPVADLIRDIERVTGQRAAAPDYQQDLFPGVEAATWRHIHNGSSA